MSLRTSYSSSKATVVEHTLRRRGFPLSDFSGHLIHKTSYTHGIDMSNDANISNAVKV